MPEPVPEDASERFAEAVCAAEFACGCGFHASQAACEIEVAAMFESIVDMGVTMDEECFDEYLASPIFTQCAEDEDAGSPPCIPLVGRGELGDPCIPWNLFVMMPGATCKESLQCSVTGVCQSPSNPVSIPNEVGATCNPEFIGSCALNYCADESETCTARVPVGEPCTQFDACEFEAYCMGLDAGVGICTPKLAIGAACEPDDTRPCVDEAWCDPTTKMCSDFKPFVCVNQPLR